MRSLWCVASIATSASVPDNVSSVLAGLDLGNQQAVQPQSRPALDPVSAVSGAVGNLIGNSVASPTVGGLIQTALGDGQTAAFVPYLHQTLSQSNPLPANTPSTLPSGLIRANRSATQTLDLAQSVLSDPTSIMNASSLYHLFPALTSGLLNNTGASNLLNLVGKMNGGTSPLGTIAGVATDPNIAAASSQLTGSPAIQGVSTLSNIGSTIQSGIDIGSANRPQSLRPQVAQVPSDTTDVRRLDTANAAAPDLFSSLTNSLAGAAASPLNLNALTGGLLGGGASNLNSLFDLNALANTLTGGALAGANNSAPAGGLNFASLAQSMAPALQAVTGTLGQSAGGNALQTLTDTAAQNLKALSSVGSAQPVATSGSQSSKSSSTLSGVAASFISNNYLNADGQTAFKSTPFAQQALQYPDLVSVINGQAPICSADGQLTPAVQTALRQVGLNVTTPAALISTITNTDAAGQTSSPITNAAGGLPAILSAASLPNTALNATSVLEDSQKALQNSLAALGANSLDPGALTNALSAAMGSAGNPASALTNLLGGGQTRVLAESSSDSVPAEEDIEDLKKALMHFNEALKRAIKANEAGMSEKANDVVTTDAADADVRHRMLSNWFSNAWDSVKSAFSSSSSADADRGDVDWKTDVNQAALELAENLESMSKKIRGMDVADMMEEWYKHAREELEAKASAVLPSVGIGSASYSPSSSFSGPNMNNGGMSSPVALRRMSSVDRSGAFSVGYDGYNFQQAADPLALGGLFPGLGNNNLLASLGTFSQPVISTLTTPFLGAMNSLSGVGQQGQQQGGAPSTTGGGGLFPGSILSQLLGGAGGMRLFQEAAGLTSASGVQPAAAPLNSAINVLGTQQSGVQPVGIAGATAYPAASQSGSMGELQLAQLLGQLSGGAMVGPTNQVVASPSNPSGSLFPSGQAGMNAELSGHQNAPNPLQSVVPTYPTVVNSSPGAAGPGVNSTAGGVMKDRPGDASSDDGDDDDADSEDGGKKSLNSIDVKEWINKLSSTDLGKTFGLDKLKIADLPMLPDIEDADLEKFLEKNDWRSFFNSIRLSELPGLQGESEGELKKMVADGKFGEILGRVHLAQLPGLESTDVNQILDQFHRKLAAPSARSLNDAASIIATGSNGLTNQLTSGSAAALQASQHSLLNQLQGITSLASGLTGLGAGLGYGLTGINTGALTGTNLLSSGIGSLLGNINSGLGQNLGSLGSGLEGLTSNIGTNLASGLGGTSQSLGSAGLALPDLSSLGSLLPSGGAGGAAVVNAANSVAAPALASNTYGLTPVSNGGLGGSAANLAAASLPTGSSAGGQQLQAVGMPSNMMQLLHAFTGTGRVLQATPASGNAPNDLLATLTSQLNGMANLSNGLGTGINQGTNLIGLGTNTLLSNINAGLGTQLGQLGSGFSTAMPALGADVGAGMADVAKPIQLQSVNNTSTSASSGIAIPDLQSILGGNYKQVQSVSDGTPTAISMISSLPNMTSIMNSTATSLPDLSSITNSLSSAAAVPDLATLMQQMQAATSVAGFPQLAQPTQLPSLSLNATGMPDLNALLQQQSAALANAANSLSSALPAALPIGGSSNPLSALTNNANSLASLLPTSNLLTPAASGQAAPQSQPPAANVGSNLAGALDVIEQGRSLAADTVLTPTEQFLKQVEKEEVMAKTMLSAEYRQHIERIKQATKVTRGTTSEAAAAEEEARQIVVLEADYQSKMDAISRMAEIQKRRAQSVSPLGQAQPEKTANSPMGNASSPGAQGAVVRRLSERSINLEHNLPLVAIPRTTEPPSAPDSGDWMDKLLPPLLRSAVDSMIHLDRADPSTPVYVTHARTRPAMPKAAAQLPGQEQAPEISAQKMPSLPTRNLAAAGFEQAAALGAGQYPFRQFSANDIAPGFNLQAVGGSLLGAGDNASWYEPGRTGFNAFGSGDVSMGAVNGFAGVDTRQFPQQGAEARGVGALRLPQLPTPQYAGVAFAPVNAQPAVKSMQSVQSSSQDVLSAIANNANAGATYVDPAAVLSALPNSDLDLSQFFRILANSNVDWNAAVTELRQGVPMNTVLSELVSQGLDLSAVVELVKKSNLDVEALSRESAQGANNSGALSLSDLLAKLDGLDLNALIKSAADTGVDLKSVLLMLSKDGIDLQSVADSAVIPMVGHVAAVSNLQNAFNAPEGQLDPHALQNAVNEVSHQLSPL